MTVWAFDRIDHALPQQLFVAADAEVRFGDHVLDGKVFVASHRGEVAACVRLTDAHTGVVDLNRLARRQELAARAEVEHDENGLSIVHRMWLHTRGSASAWADATPRDQLSDECRTWWAAVTVADMALGSRSTLPVPAAARPAGSSGDVTTIDLRGDIGKGRNTADWVRAKLGNPERCQHAVLVDIDSAGGNCEDGLAIFRALAEWPYAVHVNVRRASSMAAIIALAGDVRSIVPDGSMFLHAPAIGGTFERLDESDLRRSADRLAATAAELAGIVAVRIGTTIAAARRLIDRATTFNAGQALEWGLVHAIRADDVPAKAKPIRASFAPIDGPYRRTVAIR